MAGSDKLYIEPILNEVISGVNGAISGLSEIFSAATQAQTSALSAAFAASIDEMTATLGAVLNQMKTATEGVKTAVDQLKAAVNSVSGQITEMQATMTALNNTMGGAVNRQLTAGTATGITVGTTGEHTITPITSYIDAQQFGKFAANESGAIRVQFSGKQVASASSKAPFGIYDFATEKLIKAGYVTSYNSYATQSFDVGVQAGHSYALVAPQESGTYNLWVNGKATIYYTSAIKSASNGITAIA